MQEHQRPRNSSTAVIHGQRSAGAATLHPIKIQLLAWAGLVLDQHSPQDLATHIRPHSAQSALTQNHDYALPLKRHIVEQHDARNKQNTGSGHLGIIAHPQGTGVGWTCVTRGWAAVP